MYSRFFRCPATLVMSCGVEPSSTLLNSWRSDIVLIRLLGVYSFLGFIWPGVLSLLGSLFLLLRSLGTCMVTLLDFLFFCHNFCCWLFSLLFVLDSIWVGLHSLVSWMVVPLPSMSPLHQVGWYLKEYVLRQNVWESWWKTYLYCLISLIYSHCISQACRVIKSNLPYCWYLGVVSNDWWHKFTGESSRRWGFERPKFSTFGLYIFAWIICSSTFCLWYLSCEGVSTTVSSRFTFLFIIARLLACAKVMRICQYYC